MSTNEFLKQALDIATQAKFSYTSPGNFTTSDTLEHFRDYFGVITTQTTSSITVTMPTTGLDSTTLNYLRHFINSATSSVAITLDHGYSTLRLEPGEGVLLFWVGTSWHVMKTPGHQSNAVQGRIEDVKNKTYMVHNGDVRAGYVKSITMNADTGSSTVQLLIDGVDQTGDLTVTAGVETVYTCTPAKYLSAGAILELDITSCVSQEGLHYRVDVDAS